MKDDYPEIDEKLIRTGKIKVENIDFITDLSTLIAIKLAYSMGPEKYPEFSMILLETQNEWHVEEVWKEKLKSIALNKLHIPENIIEDCFKRKTQVEENLSNRQADILEKYEITFVPAFIVHGRVIEASYKALEKALEEGPVRSPVVTLP